MGYDHVRQVAGVFSGAPANGPENYEEFSNWLGRGLRYQSTNFGMGTEAAPFSEAKNNSVSLYLNDEGWSKTHPEVVLCVSMPVVTGPTSLPADRRRKLLSSQPLDGHTVVAERALQAQVTRGVRTIVRLGSEPDIKFNPYSMVDVEEEFTAAWGRAATRWHKVGVKEIDLSGNGSWPQRWNRCQPAPGLYTIFGGNFYMGTKNATGFGSRQEVIARIKKTQAEAKRRGKRFSIPEWGVWGDRGITEVQALAFFKDLVKTLESFPTTGPGSLAYWNCFHQKRETSLDWFPKMKAAFKEYVA